jgi:hypothetical protein
MKLTLLMALCGALLSSPQGTRRADVVVYGATAGGAVAAVTIAREGKSVLLLEPGKHVGGLTTGGLGATDTGRRQAIGGTSREFYARVREHYVKTYGADSPQVKDCSDGFHFEPHVADAVLKAMLAEAKIEVLFERRVDQVRMAGKRIESITTLKGDAFAGTVFIDASYEGDLMARAGVKYHVGREGREVYGESLAGVQARSPSHQWPGPVSALDAQGKPLPCVGSQKLDPAGTGDKKVQAYNFRLCMTNRPDNLVPWPKPANYNPARYELLARYLERFPDRKMGQLMNPVKMPNAKTDTNNNGAFSTDHIGASWDYPEADYATRDRIWQDHIEYIQGFFWFLAHDPRVPEPLQKDIRSWGLSKDEFTDTDHFPHQMYVREARRLIGGYVLTERDARQERSKPDSIGLGSYNLDSHHCQRIVDDKGNALNEGDFQVGTQPYAIPYRSITPKAEECENLLVPICCSTSHVAYGTLRMEPVFMVLGQASGVAAALAVDGKLAVQQVPYDRLAAKLREQKAVLTPEEAGAAPAVPKSALAGIVVDDADAARTGEWSLSSAAQPFVGSGYLHDGNAEKGKKSVRFPAKLPKAGRYEVRLVYSPNPNRATNIPVVIKSTGGEKTITVNQRQGYPEGKPPALGVFEFAAEGGWVEVRNEGTDGYVIADAVQFLPAEK